MHMNDGRVVSNFILQALQGEPLTVCVYSFSLQYKQFGSVSFLISTNIIRRHGRKLVYALCLCNILNEFNIKCEGAMQFKGL